MVENVRRAVEVEIAVVGEIDDGRPVRCRRELDPERRGLNEAVDAGRSQGSRKPAVAVRRIERQLDRRIIVGAELPNPVAESVGAPVQRVLVAGLPIELIGDPVKGKSAVGDAVGEPPRHSAEMGRIGEVIAQRVEAEHDPLRPARAWHDQVAQHRAISDNLRARPCPRRDRDLEHGRFVDLAENMCAQSRPPSLRVPQGRASTPHPTTGVGSSEPSSSARIAANTSRNIAAVSTPVLVL